MPRRKRKPTTFSLSFLDIMSCGLGAVVLLYLIIDHASDVHFEEVNYDLLAEVSLLEEEVLDGKDRRVIELADLMKQHHPDAWVTTNFQTSARTHTDIFDLGEATDERVQKDREVGRRA